MRKDIVDVEITRGTRSITRQGFSTPMILGIHYAFPERVRTFGGLDELGVLFSTRSPEYKAAQALLSADIQVGSFMVGRATAKDPQAFVIEWVGPEPTPGDNVSMTINNVTYAATADLAADLSKGDLSALDATGVSLTNVTYMSVPAVAANPTATPPVAASPASASLLSATITAGIVTKGTLKIPGASSGLAVKGGTITKGEIAFATPLAVDPSQITAGIAVPNSPNKYSGGKVATIALTGATVTGAELTNPNEGYTAGDLSDLNASGVTITNVTYDTRNVEAGKARILSGTVVAGGTISSGLIKASPNAAAALITGGTLKDGGSITDGLFDVAKASGGTAGRGGASTRYNGARIDNAVITGGVVAGASIDAPKTERELLASRRVLEQLQAAIQVDAGRLGVTPQYSSANGVLTITGGNPGADQIPFTLETDGKKLVKHDKWGSRSVLIVEPVLVLEDTDYILDFGSGYVKSFKTSSAKRGRRPTAEMIVQNLQRAILQEDHLTQLLDATVSGTKLTLTSLVDDLFIRVKESENLSIRTPVPDPISLDGLASDLNSICRQSEDWYAFGCVNHSDVVSLAIAEWTESKTNPKKVFAGCSSTKAILDPNSKDDVAAKLQALTRTRSFFIFHNHDLSYPEFAWMGDVLPEDPPGSVTWNLKTLKGIPTDNLSENDITALKAKNANYYISVASAGVTQQGRCCNGEYIDVIQAVDWMTARISEGIFTLLISQKKIPYTNAGITAVSQPVKVVLDDALARNILASYVITLPKVSDIPTAEKAAREFKRLSFSGVLAGAIHSVQVRGVVTV